MVRLFFHLYIYAQLIRCLEQWETYNFTYSPSNNYTQGWFVKQPYNESIYYVCQNTLLLGGFNIFGQGSLISQNFNIPPHYKLRISLNFWKIDRWNDEWAYVIVDDYSKMYRYTFTDGVSLCGHQDESSNDVVQNIQITMNHYQQSFFVIITTNLNELPENESWGVSDFKIEILRCSTSCIYCQDSITECYFWTTPMISDGWKSENLPLKSSTCIGFEIEGGPQILGANQTIEKIIGDLIPHFQVVLQFNLWTYGQQLGENFILQIDDSEINKTTLKQSGIIVECDATQEIKLTNFQILINHKQPDLQIMVQLLSNSSNNIYWGVKPLDIYVAKCTVGCDQCSGPETTQCIVCSKKWYLFNNLCTTVPPLQLSQAKVKQYKRELLIQSQAFKIYFDGIDNEINNFGETMISLDSNIQPVKITIQTKCEKNQNVSGFINNYQQFKVVQNYSNRQICQGQLNISYQLIFDQVVESYKELIINQSEVKVEIYQVVIINFVDTRILMLQIDKADNV